MSDRDRYRSAIQSVFLGLLAILLANSVLAQSQQKGDGSIRVEYQYIGTGAYNTETIMADYWTTDSHIALMFADYALSERWRVYASLPYVQKCFVADPKSPFGGDPHNPNDPYFVDFERQHCNTVRDNISERFSALNGRLNQKK